MDVASSPADACSTSRARSSSASSPTTPTATSATSPGWRSSSERRRRRRRSNAQGRAELLRRAEADLIVRYQSQVVSTRLATLDQSRPEFDFAKLPRRNFIDDELFKRLESLKVPPSPPASDAAFLRRVSLDLTGEQPTPEQIRQFLADTDPDKRVKLVDQLLAQPEFVRFWQIKLGDLLQISPARQGNGAYRYQAWLDRCLAKNTPWDAMVRSS